LTRAVFLPIIKGNNLIGLGLHRQEEDRQSDEATRGKGAPGCFIAFVFGAPMKPMDTLREIALSSSQMSLGDLLAEYRMSLEAMNRSEKTISWYLDIIGRYLVFLDSNSLLKAVDLLGRQELKAYVLRLQEATRWAGSLHVKRATGKLSPYSVQGHVRAVKAFWGWLEREEYITHNPLAKYPLPRVPQKPVSILTTEQLGKLFSGIDRRTPLGARYQAILMLLLDTGIRVSELVNIRMEDMDLRNGYIRVTGKGQKVRFVPISSHTRREIARYVNFVRPRVDSPALSYLFAKPDGRPISANNVQQFLRRLANKAGLSGVRCSPHVFRHTFATQSVVNWANVFVLREIMGHSTLQTTMKYTHLQPQDLQAHHAGFSPVANLALTLPALRPTR